MSDSKVSRFPLPMAPHGQPLRVLDLSANKATHQRLCSMGISPGCELRVVQRSAGNLVVAIGNTRLAIGPGIAQKVFVAAA